MLRVVRQLFYRELLRARRLVAQENLYLIIARGPATWLADMELVCRRTVGGNDDRRFVHIGGLVASMIGPLGLERGIARASGFYHRIKSIVLGESVRRDGYLFVRADGLAERDAVNPDRRGSQLGLLGGWTSSPAPRRIATFYALSVGEAYDLLFQ